MPCVPALALVRDALRDGYAVPALEVETCDMAEAVLEAAAAARSPLILQVVPYALELAGWARLVRHLRGLCDTAPLPVALHLDHATTVGGAMRALDGGFTSVMYDGSFLAPAENTANTAHVVEAAHRHGLSVEGEIGHVGREGESPGVDRLTDADAAQSFARATGVDMLAVAIGTRHGRTPGPGGLDLDRLAEIRARVDTPLVLHGGSGVDEPALRAAIAGGIAKVNVGAALNRAYMAAAAEGGETPAALSARAREAVAAAARATCARLSSEGRL